MVSQNFTVNFSKRESSRCVQLIFSLQLMECFILSAQWSIMCLELILSGFLWYISSQVPKQDKWCYSGPYHCTKPLCLSNFYLNLQKLYTTPMIENPEPSNIVWPQYFIYMAYKDVVQGQVNVPSLDTDQNSICWVLHSKPACWTIALSCCCVLRGHQRQYWALVYSALLSEAHNTSDDN